MSAGQRFRAYIAVDEEETELYEWLTKALKKETGYVGANRTSGYGKCRITYKGEMLPYSQAAQTAGGQKEIYMYLASNLSMRNAYGEICGLDLERLARLLDVGSLELIASSTSVCKMSGVNRTWGCRTPEAVMYEAGSVFRFKADRDIPPEAMERVRQSGVGIKREEGCGQVLFLRDYAGFHKKEAFTCMAKEPETKSALTPKEIKRQMKFVAREMTRARIKKAMVHYVAEEEITGITKSQRGIALNFARYVRVEGTAFMETIEKYLTHEAEKAERSKRQFDGKDKQAALHYLKKMVHGDIFDKLKIDKKESVCGISIEQLFSPEEIQLFQMELLEKVLTYANRKEKNQDE